MCVVLGVGVISVFNAVAFLACVHRVSSTLGCRGQVMLDVIFVELVNPPRSIQLVGLLPNVVLLYQTSTTIMCKMPDDTVVSLSQSQIELAPNFAMTDYSSQGKTRPYNPVHLDYCKSYQACYTALSRTATAKGTILLQPLSPSRVQGGLNGALRQEFRELELLDEITTLRYEKCLPLLVRGSRRFTLIDTYRKVKGEYYVPQNVHTAIMWSHALPFQPNFIEDIPWHILNKPKKNKTQQKGESVPIVSPLAIESKKENTMTSQCKRKGRQSDTCPVLPCIPKPFKKGHIVSRSVVPSSDPSANPYDTQWSNNSCAYDAFFAIMFNLWRSDVPVFSQIFHAINPTYLGFLSDAFDRHIAGSYSLVQVRDFYRWELNRLHANYLWGHFTSLSTLLECSMKQSELVVHNFLVCSSGHRTDFGFTCLPLLDIQGSTMIDFSIQGWLTGGWKNSLTWQSCMTCNDLLNIVMQFVIAPSIVCIDIGNMSPSSVDVMISISIDQSPHIYDLVGMAYFGEGHFVAQFVDKHGLLWFQDEVNAGGAFVNEGYLCDHSTQALLKPGMKKAAFLVYVR